METYVCGLCSDVIQAEADLFRQLNCSFRKCPGDAFHETCLTKYLKRHGHGPEQKTGYPCPAVLDNDENCSGTIRKTLTRVPINEKKKQQNRQAAVVVNAIHNTARVAKVTVANPAPTRITINAKANAKSTASRLTMEPEEDQKPGLMKLNVTARNGGLPGNSCTKRTWDTEILKAAPMKLAVAKNAAMAPVQVVRQRLQGQKPDKGGKEYTLAEQREIAKALRAEALGMAGRGAGHGASLQQQTKSSGNAWGVSGSTASRAKESPPSNVRSFDHQELEAVVSVTRRAKAPNFESKNPYGVFSSEDDSESDIAKAAPVSNRAFCEDMEVISPSLGTDSAVCELSDSAGHGTPPNGFSKDVQITSPGHGIESAVGALADKDSCVTPPITPLADTEPLASYISLDGTTPLGNTVAFPAEAFYGSLGNDESDPIVSYEMLYEMDDTIVVLRDEGFVPVERIYANPEFYMFPDDSGNNLCYVGIRQSYLPINSGSEGVECLSVGLSGGNSSKVEDIQHSSAIKLPEPARSEVPVDEESDDDDDDLTICLSLCLGGVTDKVSG